MGQRVLARQNSFPEQSTTRFRHCSRVADPVGSGPFFAGSGKFSMDPDPTYSGYVKLDKQEQTLKNSFFKFSGKFNFFSHKKST